MIGRGWGPGCWVRASWGDPWSFMGDQGGQADLQPLVSTYQAFSCCCSSSLPSFTAGSTPSQRCYDLETECSIGWGLDLGYLGAGCREG